MHNSIVWLKRDLRLNDHTSLSSAIDKNHTILPVFIFDIDILERFKDKDDMRLSFLAETISYLNESLKKWNGEILILHGKAVEIIPKLSSILNINEVFSALDYEPNSIKRDQNIRESLTELDIDFTLEEDHVLIPVSSIMKKDNTPYKVYGAYKKIWKTKIHEINYNERITDLKKAKFFKIKNVQKILEDNNIKIVDSSSCKNILEKVGYNYTKLPTYWQLNDGSKRLHDFAKRKLQSYKNLRDYMGEDGTSRLSAYIRFGLVSIRECYRAVKNKPEGEYWINELIWRDFYKMIIYYFPYSSNSEFKQVYKNTIEWENDQEKFNAWCEGRTGYPLIDAAMRQLTNTGWMHNRMRMITASFLSKHLLIDWKKGEEYFAQYLMDYDLSSNVGGWQWCASTGNDAQPYFRIFNPTAQAKTYDKQAKYIKKYVKELIKIPVKYIYEPKKYSKSVKYPDPIVDHQQARIKAIKVFKEAKSSNQNYKHDTI